MANHHVLPKVIRVKKRGMVNFAGFHQILVYKPGTGPEEITVPAFPPTCLSLQAGPTR